MHTPSLYTNSSWKDKPLLLLLLLLLLLCLDLAGCRFFR